jgi:hypothetical protein
MSLLTKATQESSRTVSHTLYITSLTEQGLFGLTEKK